MAEKRPMEDEEAPPSPASSLAGMGIAELEAHIARLEAEIARAREMLARKRAERERAAALFRLRDGEG